MINTIYGLSGADTFQLFDPKIASSCTAIARKLTYLARVSIEELQLG
jgi:DNA polymerase elongation subunit (family B)